MPSVKPTLNFIVTKEIKDEIKEIKVKTGAKSEGKVCFDLLVEGLKVYRRRASKSEIGKSNTNNFSDDSIELAKKFENLDGHGKDAVNSVMDAEWRRMDAKKKKTEIIEIPTRIIPLVGNSFAAGIGEPDFGNALEEYEIPADTRADFAIRVNGDSMEPWLHDGEIALGIRSTPRDGDVAALIVDGAFYVKQVCKDNYGNFYLFSLNRKRKDMDVVVKESAGSNVSCFGIIPLPERIPLPDD